MGRSSDKYVERIQALKEKFNETSEDLREQREQGRSEMQKTMLKLMRDLMKDQDLDGQVTLRKAYRTHTWVFELTFDEGDMINRQDVREALEEVHAYASASGFSAPITEGAK